KQWITREAERSFDLTKDLLLRATLLVLRGAEHVLLATMHHVASDGWSIGVLLHELSLGYGARLRGEAPALPSLPIQYADFAAWQRDVLTRDVLAEQLDRWVEALEGAPRVLELPFDHPRPAIQRFHGRTVRFRVDPDVSARLATLSQRTGSTTFMTLMSAFAVLLSRLSGQRDLLIGSPISNRSSVDTEQMIGCFINTLVYRARLDGDPRFSELLSAMHETALAAFARRDVPFEHLIERLQPERNLSHTPLFQVMFILQNAPREPARFPGATVRKIDRESTTSKLDLTLWMEETPAGLAGGFEYNTDLFDASTIERWVSHFQVLLAAIADAPDERALHLPLLTPTERHQLLDVWNATHAELPRAATVHELFEAQVARTPKALAVEHGDERIGYEELDRRANQLASYLERRGVGPNVLVGLAVERSIDLVVGLLGIMKAGGAYVPLDPAFPKQRLEYMIQDSRMRVLVTEDRVLSGLRLDLRGLPVVRLDGDAREIAAEPSARPAIAASPEQLAYVIYTSGSTGRPKGVRIRHRAVANLLLSMAREPGIEPHDALLAVTTISFDIAALELYLPLVTGARVVLASREIAVDGARLESLLRSSGATILQATPSTWRMLILAGWTGSPNLKILVGGEALPSPLAEQLLARARCVYNVYGPTETTIWSTVEEVLPGSFAGRDVVPIGRPIANTRVLVLDRGGELAPVGVHGELLIGGEGLAKGYLDRPELTEERFVPDPFVHLSDGTPVRLYRTGDRARWLADGRIEFLGRIDFQVKLRGFRIELGEVESVLAESPAIREAVAIVREDQPGDQRLVAYYVPKGEDPGSAELRAWAKNKLPDYMVPSLFVAMDRLPLTPNGKVDRTTLPSPKELNERAKASFQGPRNALELQLVQIWEGVLRVQPISVHDNFFELGGHSLLAITLIDVMQQRLGRSISLITLFRSPTIAEVADVLTGNGFDVQPWHALEVIQSRGDRTPLFFVGSTLYARALSKAMGAAQPIYGLNIFGLHPNDGTSFGLTIPEVAERYVEDVRAVQPEGPYNLIGYCADAKIASEMAHQLIAAGQRVSFLGFIDEIWCAKRDVPALVKNNLRSFGIGYLAHKAEQRVRYVRHKATVTWSLLERRLRTWAGWAVPLHLEHEVLIKGLYQALGTYRPKRYPGRITLFLSSEHKTKLSPEFIAMADDGLEVHETPGFHVALFTPPQVEILATQITECLDRAEGSPGPSTARPTR
ncbi:amino acid adenylation domain-containing protein, partial [Myxococcota bacterium]|nr:amino acid adenylation domain-containing protein [Myxococcota bacterium]